MRLNFAPVGGPSSPSSWVKMSEGAAAHMQCRAARVVPMRDQRLPRGGYPGGQGASTNSGTLATMSVPSLNELRQERLLQTRTSQAKTCIGSRNRPGGKHTLQ